MRTEVLERLRYGDFATFSSETLYANAVRGFVKSNEFVSIIR